MSYVVLARKWRPMLFEDVVAQSHITTTLKNAIKNDRLASAYLFSGPRGVGKTTTARILAKAINCEQGPTVTPCNQCSACQEINGSRSLDVLEIDGASNRGIDEIRNLRENLRYAASRGKYKIYIIDEVHMLTTEAFNALLKTLEEPPPKVMFIFATTEPHKVLATILSRCQRYDFRRIPLAEIVQQLRHICDSEGIGIDDEALYVIARKSDGSMRDSQSLLDQVVSFCGTEVQAGEVSELLGLIDQDVFFECSDSIAQKDVRGALGLVERVFASGYDLGEFLNGLAEHFRNILVFKTTQDMALLEGLDSYRAKYESAVGAFSETDLLRLTQMASGGANQIKRAANPRLILETLMLKMVNMDRSVELQELLTQINRVAEASAAANPKMGAVAEGGGALAKQRPAQATRGEHSPATKGRGQKDRVAPGPEPTDAVSSAPSSPAPEDMAASLDTIKRQWPEIIAEVKGQKLHLGSFLVEGYPTDLDDGVLEISFGKENGFHIDMLNKNRAIIERAIRHRAGVKVRIRCRKNESEEFKQILKQHKPMPITPVDEGDEGTERIPMIKKIIEVFDGEIIQ